MDSTSPVAMEPDINKLLEEIPNRPPRSKLEMHADVINVSRRKRYTYREIARFFQEHLAKRRAVERLKISDKVVTVFQGGPKRQIWYSDRDRK